MPICPIKVGDFNVFQPKCMVGREVIVSSGCAVGESPGRVICTTDDQVAHYLRVSDPARGFFSPNRHLDVGSVVRPKIFYCGCCGRRGDPSCCLSLSFIVRDVSPRSSKSRTTLDASIQGCTRRRPSSAISANRLASFPRGTQPTSTPRLFDRKNHAPLGSRSPSLCNPAVGAGGGGGGWA